MWCYVDIVVVISASCHLIEYLTWLKKKKKTETWVWKISVNALSLTHIPLSPPTVFLFLPVFVLLITTLHFFISDVSQLHLVPFLHALRVNFFVPCLCLYICFFLFLNKGSLSLILCIPPLLLHTLKFFDWYFFLLMPSPVVFLILQVDEDCDMF